MRTTLILLVSILLSNCGETKKSTTKKEVEITIPDSLKSSTLEGEEILVGTISLEQLNLFSPWYATEYDFYKVNSEAAEELKPLVKDISITLLMGTWCEDSQREVSPMIKILEAAGYPVSSIEIIAVSEDKDTPDGIEKPFDLFNVPTLIFTKNGEEINRIVEFPIQTLEQDMLEILKGNDYKNAYAE
jgi:thiol-disulfide isomerase/thioredoxin